MGKAIITIIVGVELVSGMFSFPGCKYSFRRLKSPYFSYLFITPRELIEECNKNSEPRYTWEFDPQTGERKKVEMDIGMWIVHRKAKVRELKGIKFDPPLLVYGRHTAGGDLKHLIIALFNEYWQATGGVKARHVPYILTLSTQPGEPYFMEYIPFEKEDSPGGRFIGLLEQKFGFNFNDGCDAFDALGEHWLFPRGYSPDKGEGPFLIDYDSIRGGSKEKMLEYIEKHREQMQQVLGYKLQLLELVLNLYGNCELTVEEERELKMEIYRLFGRYQREIWQRIFKERGMAP